MGFAVQIMVGGGALLMLGVVLGWLSREWENRWLRTELGIANDQLRAAIFTGAVVPPRELVTGKPQKSALAEAGEKPIPDFLEPYINRYESDEGKAAARGEIFSLRARGMTDDEIWIHLQRQHPDLQ